MKYLKVFTDFATSLDTLSDAECGRLFKAMLCYASAGQEPDFRGNERFLWPAAKQSIDRDSETYRRKAGAALRATEARLRTITYDNVQKNTITYDSVQDKDKDKDKDDAVRACAREAAAASGSTGGQACVQACAPLMTDAEMDAASEAFARIMEAMEAVGIKATAYNCDQVMAMQAEYGMDRVLDAIHRAAEGDRKGGISLAFLRAILAREQGGGTPDADEAEARRARDEARTLARLRGELPK